MRKGSPWLTGVRQLGDGWSRDTTEYTKEERWEWVGSLAEDSVQAKYLPNKRNDSQAYLVNVFDMLQIDFRDQDNPIGAILATFHNEYAQLVAPSLKAVLDGKKADQATYILTKEASELLQFTRMLKDTVVNLYTPIEDLLKSHVEELVGLLLSLVVADTLYRLLEDLEVLAQDSTIRRVRLWSERKLSFQEMNVPLEEYSTAVELSCREVDQLLRELTTTENVYEKLLLLQRYSQAMASAEPHVRVQLAAWTVTRASQSLLPVHLELVKLFYPDCPSLLFEAVQAFT